jgi:sugar phosphate isomerase/epimerase
MQHKRRTFLKQMAAGLALPLVPAGRLWPDSTTGTADHDICLFSKHVQWLDFGDMGHYVRDVGFDGVDLTVRKGGHVEPDEVVRRLPQALREIRKSGTGVPMMTTNISDADDPLTVQVLETAAGEGIRFYRMDWYRYDPSMEIMENLEILHRKMEKLAALNEKYRIHGAYQNHSGNYVGASVWDVRHLLEGLNPEWTGCQFDIRHATVEGGESWPSDLRLIKNWVRCSVIKDFHWLRRDDGRWVVHNVPLGDGMVDFGAYLEQYRRYDLKGPISLHVEYDFFPVPEESLTKKEKMQIARSAFSKDLQYLRESLLKAGIGK